MAILFGMTAGVAVGADKGLELYHKAIAAKTIGERQAALEAALEFYLAQYNAMKDQGKMNGLLCYNIGNCYFNLGQLGEAILYYKTGLKLLPVNETIRANLQIALDKRNNPVDMESGGIKETLLFFHYKIGPDRRIDVLVVSCIVTALFLIGLMFRPSTPLKYLSAICVTAVICLFISIGVTCYMPKHEGVVLQTTDVRKGPGTGFAPATANPFGEGSTIQVLSSQDGWFLVKLNDGRKGYVLKDHLKIVL